MRVSERALCLLACLGLSGGCQASPRRIEIADPRAHWPGGDFAEMVPAVRLPTSLDGMDHITIWLRIPGDGRITVRRASGRLVPTYPPGTEADRVELHEPASWETEHAWSVVDVRGTTIGEDGLQYFHCLQPTGIGGTLAGFEWPRGDVPAERAAADGLAVIAGSRLAGLPEEVREQKAQRLRQLNRCEGCHQPEQVAASRAVERGPRRPTDTAGFYGILDALADSAPLEEHRPRELNGEDAFITVSCGARAATAPGRGAHFRCPDGGVPIARFDLERARAAAQAHALAVCRSRRYLFAHMSDAARVAFAAAFEECGIQR
jgi:hypothetical protein